MQHAKVGYEESPMRRERIVRKAPVRPRRPPEILPLDPRDPDVLRAKALVAQQRLPRGHRAA
jgi:hypothetical protein